ncbi:hypothetical protein ACSLBF_06070 [Pseudoalteromonas sp. T1lg65]|uniref:hypothetical protein n=1 Tax=Pseudoalteromonas sp. T1lg65 TaxID=2077101 RepID=UPI003F798485
MWWFSLLVCALSGYITTKKINQQMPIVGELIAVLSDRYVEIHSDTVLRGQIINSTLWFNCLLEMRVKTESRTKQAMWLNKNAVTESDWRRLIREMNTQ